MYQAQLIVLSHSGGDLPQHDRNLPVNAARHLILPAD